jgi:hypothetical protein
LDLFMARRRDLLRFGIAASLWPLAHATAAISRGTLPEPGALPIDCLVYDPRFAAARAIGQQATALGLDAYRIDGDVAALWYDDLHPCARQRPLMIAGVTTGSALFCLREMARDANLRLRHHLVHRAGEDLATIAFDPNAWAAGSGSVRRPDPIRSATMIDLQSNTTLHSWLIGPAAAR